MHKPNHENLTVCYQRLVLFTVRWLSLLSVAFILGEPGSGMLE